MTRQECGRFLEGIARGWSPSRAEKLAGVSPGTAVSYRKRNAAFAEAWACAHEAGTDRFEDTAADRAINGTTKGVWYKGELVGYEREYSDRLLLSVLAARRPRKWKQFELAGGDEGGAPIARGSDVIALLEQKLAGLEARAIAGELEERSPFQSDD